MIAEMSQWKLTQIKSTGAREPTLGEATLPLPSRKIAPSRGGAWAGRLTLVPDLQEIALSPRGAWQLMGVRSCHGPAPFFVPPTQKDQRPAPDQTGATGKHSIDYVVTTPPASIRCLLRTQNISALE